MASQKEEFLNHLRSGIMLYVCSGTPHTLEDMYEALQDGLTDKDNDLVHLEEAYQQVLQEMTG